MLKVKIFSGSMRAATALLAVAAEALGVPAAAIDLRIGDSALPPAMIAGGSMGTASWTCAVIKACGALRDQVRARDGAVPPGGLTAHARVFRRRPARAGLRRAAARA